MAQGRIGGAQGRVGDAQKALGETADKMDEYEEFKPNVASMISAAEAL